MVLSVNNLSKSYKNKPLRKCVRGLFGIGERDFALKDISFEISKGECVGIIGANGSGKSTLLKIICGITAPTSGSFRATGRISALLELGTGFNPEYNGISNIYLNGMMQGLTKAETKALIPEICDFAEIGDYINRPVKTYSDGMFLRLAFACAIAVKPDILIIDEALAVGDFKFRQKCFSKIQELKRKGVTILMVSHDIDIIRRFCTRAIWLDKGELKADDNVRKVSALYMESLTGSADIGLPQSYKNRFGSAVGSVCSVSLPKLMQTGKPCKIMCKIDIPKDVNLQNTALSISFKNIYGLDLSVISTADSDIRFTKYGRQTVNFDFICRLCPGKYSLSVSLEDRGVYPIRYYDYADGIEVFEVTADKEYFGTFYSECEVNIFD